MSRHFERDFATDLLTVSAGNLSGVNGGPLTVAIVFRLDTVTPTQILIKARTAASADVWVLLNDGGTLFFDMSGAGFRTCVSGLAANTWYLYAVTKGAGSAQVRDHLCDMATDTWTHADRGTPLGDGSGTVDHLRFSDGSSADRVDGYEAAAAVYTSVLNDAAVEALRPGLAAWTTAAALWRMNDIPVNDLTAGGANQTAIDGTTVDTGVEPPGFSYTIGDVAPVVGKQPRMIRPGAGPSNLGRFRKRQMATSAPPAGQIAVTIGQATETATAFAVTRLKAKAVAQAAETDTAIAITRRKTRLVGQALEADTATAVARRKVRALGLASEADSATVLARAKTRLLGQTAETDSARPITPPGALMVAVGQAVETAVALAVGRLKRRTLGQPADTETAFSVGRRKAFQVSQAVETDTALVVTAGRGIVQRPTAAPVGRPSAVAVARPTSVAVGRPTATAVARPTAEAVNRP